MIEKQIVYLKISIALIIGFAFAGVWFIFEDIAFQNKFPFNAFEFNGLYPLGIGVSAIITSLFFDKNISSLGLKSFKIKHLIASIFTAIALVFIPLLINIISGFTKLNEHPKFNINFVLIGIPVTLILAFGEEIMWRGFLFTNFSKLFGYKTTSIIIGLIWGLWHYPVIIRTGFIYADRPIWFALTMLTLLTLSLSFIYNYLRLVSNSVWTCVIVHGLTNFFVIALIEPVESLKSPEHYYYLNDIGIVYVFISFCGAVYCYLKSKTSILVKENFVNK